MKFGKHNILTTPGANAFELFDEIDKIASDMMRKSDNYPPYNIYSTGKDESSTVIEMSVLGFKKDEINVTLHSDEGELIITGINESSKEKREYSYRGLSMKNFKRTFTVNSNLEINEVTMVDGILTITFLKKEKKTVSFDIK
jgi:HSP20 family molecular chaperone IbpA